MRLRQLFTALVLGGVVTAAHAGWYPVTIVSMGANEGITYIQTGSLPNSSLQWSDCFFTIPENTATNRRMAMILSSMLANKELWIEVDATDCVSAGAWSGDVTGVVLTPNPM